MFPTEYKDGTITFTTTTPTLNHDIFDNYYQTIPRSDGGFTIKATTQKPFKITWTDWFDESKPFKLPKKYIINDKVCVLVWEDGSMTKIKKSPDDEFDPVKAFLWAWFQHTCGLPKWKANNYLREVEENCINNITKKRKKDKKIVTDKIEVV